MKNVFRVVALLVAVGLVSAVEAKTTKYEVTNLQSYNGWINFPGLELNNATSAILTVSRTPPSPEPKIVSLEISFPKAAKLTATNFKLIDGSKYRAVVAGAWIYKEVIIDLNGFSVDASIHVEGYVSERTAYINPISDTQNPTASIFNLQGMLNDVTATKIVDQEVLILASKKLTLSLKDRLIYQSQPRAEGFAIDALWYGRGTKTLFLPASVPREQFDTIDAVGIVIAGDINDPVVSVKFKDFNGYESESPQVRLRDLLDQTFRSTP